MICSPDAQHSKCKHFNCQKKDCGIHASVLTRTDILTTWEKTFCSKKWLKPLVVKHSTNISESIHNNAWQYAPKFKYNNKATVEAGVVLAMIHTNSGLKGIAGFMEKLGYSARYLHELFYRSDRQSLARSKYAFKRYEKTKEQNNSNYGPAVGADEIFDET